jgi:hypothetical protein
MFVRKQLTWAAKRASLALLMLPLVGCDGQSGATTTLSGQVTIGGQPIPSEATASVSFRPIGGQKVQPVSALIADGAYRCDDVPVGAVVAEFDIRQPVGPMKTSARTGAQYQEEKTLVPTAHAAGIEFEVKAGDASRNFEL